jgi:transposase
MTKYPPSFKHHILSQYQSKQYGKGLHSLARYYNIKGGRQALQYWYNQWNGTIDSLKHKHGTGRPTKLNSTQQKQ